MQAAPIQEHPIALAMSVEISATNRDALAVYLGTRQRRVAGWWSTLFCIHGEPRRGLIS